MSQDISKYLVCILGQTAVGKTALSIELAGRFDTEIISIDSRQIYKELTIGTAKPNEVELQRIRHHFINHISITERFSAGEFEKQALNKLMTLFKEKDVTVAAGGTGLYAHALINGLDEFPEISDEVSNEIEIDYQNKGLEYLIEKLAEIDPKTYQTIDLKNPRRVIRALEVSLSGNRVFSEYKQAEKPKRPFKVIPVMLRREKSELRDRIHLRVDLMIKNGLIDEVRTLEPFKDLRAMQTVGYQEVFEYLAGRLNLTETAELIKTHTRQYAKRQGTYFKKHFPWPDFHPSMQEDILEYVKTKLDM